MRGRSRRGVALLTALLMVAVMSTIAFGLSDASFVAVRRADAVQQNVQARWLAFGAESLALETLILARRARPDIASRNDPWAAPRILPAPGGIIQGQVRDAGNCFNVNTLTNTARFDDDRTIAEHLFFNLAQALEIDAVAARGVADAVRDWIDADATPSGPGGAEDYDYQILTPPYRTGAAPLAAVSEMRAIAGVSDDVYRRLRPFLCAEAASFETSVNINTLETRDAPLLQMMLGEAMTREQARALIAARPVGGWVSLAAFRAAPQMRDVTTPESLMGRFRLTSSRYAVDVAVTTDRAYVRLRSLLFAGDDGRAFVIRRTFGEET